MFQEALAEILSRLETARSRGLLSRYALIGGFAVSAWGLPRATQDFDFTIAIDQADPHAQGDLIGSGVQSHIKSLAAEDRSHLVESAGHP